MTQSASQICLGARHGWGADKDENGGLYLSPEVSGQHAPGHGSVARDGVFSGQDSDSGALEGSLIP